MPLLRLTRPFYLIEVLQLLRPFSIFYFNTLNTKCYPGDKVKIIFYLELPTRRKTIKQIIQKKFIRPQTTTNKKKKRKKKRRKKKGRLQSFEGIVIAQKPVRFFDLFFPTPKVLDFQTLVKSERLYIIRDYDVEGVESSIIFNYKKRIRALSALYSIILHWQDLKWDDLYSPMFINSGGAPATSQILKVRRIVKSIIAEKTFCTNSPWVKNIERIYSSIVRRAKLYYLRDKTGKKARLKRGINFI